MTGKRRRLVLGIGAAALALLAFAGGGAAYAAATAQPAIKTITPRSERDITNLDVLRQQIRNYYGDPLGSASSPTTATTPKRPVRSPSPASAG